MLEKIIKWILYLQCITGGIFRVNMHYHNLPITTKEHVVMLALLTATTLVYFYIRRQKSNNV
jgi:hypothetical protein